MTIQSALQAVEPHDSHAALLAEILAINSELSNLQSRVSRLAQKMATRQAAVAFDEYSSDVLQAVSDAMGRPERVAEDRALGDAQVTVRVTGVDDVMSSRRHVMLHGTDGRPLNAPCGLSNVDGSGEEREPEGWDESQMGPWSLRAQARAEERGYWPPKPDNMDGGGDTMEAAPAIMEPPLEPAPQAPKATPTPRVPQSPACQSVLTLYGDSALTPAEISRHLKINSSSVGCYLSMGRKAGDPRVVKGDAARRPKAPEQQEAEDEVVDVVETVIVPVDESAPEPQEPARPVQANEPETRIFRRVPRFEEDEGPARLRIPSVPAPAPKAKPVEAPAEEPRGTPMDDFPADKIMDVDVESLKVHGPWGSVDVVRPFARSLERMVDGNTYDVDTLRDLGPWPRTDAMKDHFSVMRRKLAAVGIDLVSVNKFMFRVRRVEG
jgi:hypothetical protein